MRLVDRGRLLIIRIIIFFLYYITIVSSTIIIFDMVKVYPFILMNNKSFVIIRKGRRLIILGTKECRIIVFKFE